ncbi:hypothetical protein R2F61_05030 [Mollicutes bacterium LVI A0078]|nr:hypothetical protein RZE84_05050 [Mollicutes bacterium LVI A0075]WOO90091.1 hypothetical protein R2F61_05030 [Mollicutes bacterium LVI A0078]
MLIGKNIRRISHNLVISKYFEEENSQIQNEYFIRNIADELSVVSLGFGGFLAVINPCSFEIEYSSDTFKDLTDINLVEVEKFEPKAATIFRIEGIEKLPEFDFEYIRTTLSEEAQITELDEAIEAITGINDQYSLEQGSLGTSFDSIELNVEALNAANYKHIEDEEYQEVAKDEEAQSLADEIAMRKQELEKLNQELASREVILKEAIEEDAPVASVESEGYSHDMADFESALDQLNDFLEPDDLFAELGFMDLEDEEE